MAILDHYAGLVIDLDGVVFRADEPIPEAVTFLRRARKAGVPMVFVTNNAARRAAEWLRLFEQVRLTIPPDVVLGSAMAAAWMLQGDRPPRVFTIGETGLDTVLVDAGVPITTQHDDAEAVVVGWDRHLTWDKLRRATLAIHRGARFVGTNGDAVYPAPEGPWPGNGAALAFLRTATGVAPEVAGKPQTPLFELAAERLDVSGDVLVVGDQVETDVVAAQRMGWDSALALTGVSSWSSIVGAGAMPTWVIRHLAELDGPEPPTVRHAREADLSRIHELLAATGFDTTGAARRLPDTLVAEDPGGRVVGTISWEPVGNAAHLRAITVAEKERGHHTGSQLVARALDELARKGIDWVYLLTPGAESLFERLGFWQVTRDRVPRDVLDTAQFGAADHHAAAMVRRLGGGRA
jgi:4-nitrophenyl phosphatase